MMLWSVTTVNKLKSSIINTQYDVSELTIVTINSADVKFNMNECVLNDLITHNTGTAEKLLQLML